MKPERLLAKKHPTKVVDQGNPPGLLVNHLKDVSRVCVLLADCLGEESLNNMGISGDLYQLATALKWFGWIHDLGKANSHFQEMLRKSGRQQVVQLLRHEVISGLLMQHEPNLQSWIQELPEMTRYVLMCAVLSHHRKFGIGVEPKLSEDMEVFTTHPDWLAILREMSSDLDMDPPKPVLKNLVISYTRKTASFTAASELQSLRKQLSIWAQTQEREMKALVALTKALGIAGDVAASALGSTGAEEFIQKHLTETGLTPSDFQQLIDMKTRPTDNNPVELRAFQMEAARSSSTLTLIEAGCGTGKSLAAYLWAQSWSKDKPKRLFFCMPTMGTATEQYIDYALQAGVAAELIHSKATIDLERLREQLAKEEDEEGDGEQQFQRQQDVIESLRAWSTPLVVCTVDTVLGLLVNFRRGLYSFPAMMNGVFVFDEAHALDSRLFSLLLMFLKYFPNLPVLVMTASLPKWKKRLLQQARSDMAVISGPVELEELPRYLIQHADAVDQLESQIRSTLAAGGKVLWVCNQVEWAMDAYRQCKEKFARVEIDIYHSRFRYKDRSVRHRRVIDRFKKAGEPMILVTTQVAEMSLDLSADLLISDLAPIPALIQRLGRLNRKASPDNSGDIKTAFIVSLDGKSCAPYKFEDLEDGRQWVNTLERYNSPLCQKDLKEAAWLHERETNFSWEEAERSAVFFSGIWETTMDSNVREQGYTVPVLLEKDVSLFREAHDKEPDSNWIREHEIPMTIRKEMFSWEKVGHIPVARDSVIRYDYDFTTDRGEGAKWQTS